MRNGQIIIIITLVTPQREQASPNARLNYGAAQALIDRASDSPAGLGATRNPSHNLGHGAGAWATLAAASEGVRRDVMQRRKQDPSLLLSLTQPHSLSDVVY